MHWHARSTTPWQTQLSPGNSPTWGGGCISRKESSPRLRKQNLRRQSSTPPLEWPTLGGAPMTLPLIQDLTGNLPTAETVAYAPTPGVPALRDAWKKQMLAKNPGLVGRPQTTRPMVVPGLTAGITMIADLFTGAGDTLLVPDLFWGNYRLIFEERRQCGYARVHVL